MRRMIVLACFVFGFSAGAVSADILPEARYQRDGWAICRERHPLELLDECFRVAARSASVLAAMERAVPVEPAYALDGDTDRKRAQQVAVTCRELTMDGELVDAITAMACVYDEVGVQNWAARRERRLREEATSDE